MCSADAGHGKPVVTVTSQQRNTVSRESRRLVKPLAPRKKRRRLNDLDSDSTVDEEESEDEFQLSDRCVFKIYEYLEYYGFKFGILGFKSGGFYTSSSKYNGSSSDL